MSEKQPKFLTLSLKAEMSEILKLYLEEIGMDPQIIGYYKGYIEGASDKRMVDITTALNLSFFYAGIYCHMKHRDKLKIGRTKKGVTGILKEKRDEDPTTYMG